MAGPKRYNDPRWRRPCYNCGYTLTGEGLGEGRGGTECPRCGNVERENPWKDCPNQGCDGELRAHHAFVRGGYKTGRLGCPKCGSTVNFAAKIETVITPKTDKEERPPGVISLMNELVGREGEPEEGTPTFLRFTRRSSRDPISRDPS